jgi:hypothetical protein
MMKMDFRRTDGRMRGKTRRLLTRSRAKTRGLDEWRGQKEAA